MNATMSDIWPEPKLEQVALTIDGGDTPYTDDHCYCGQEGWARFTKKVVLTHDLTKETANTHGTLLYAEWIDAVGIPWRIAPDPASPGAFSKFAFREGLGDLYMKEQITVFGDNAAHGMKLNYAVYWQDKGDGAVTRVCDSFTGFEKDAT
jgi:hypothetical protein